MHGGSPSGRGDDGRSRSARFPSDRPIRSAAVVSLVVLVVVATGIAVADSGTVSGRPGLDVLVPDNQFEAGADATLDIEIPNEGRITTDGSHPPEAEQRAKEARSVRANVTDVGDAPIDVRTGQQSVGTIGDGETGTTSFDILVEDDAEPGEYDIEVELKYRDARTVEYEEVGDNQYNYEETVLSQTKTYDVTVVVEDEARFEIDDITHNVQVDELGNVTATITNTGTENASDAVVTANTQDDSIFFGSGSGSSDAFVGDWAPGETKTVTYRTGAGEEAIPKPYPLSFDFSYTNEDGEDVQRTETRHVTPLDRQRYAVEYTSHDVAIGDDGILEVGIRNLGPRDVTDASVTLEANDAAIAFGSAGEGEPAQVDGVDLQTQDTGAPSTEAFLGDWEAGERRTILVRTGVEEDGVPRNYTLDATVAARDQQDNTLNERTRQFGFQPYEEQTFALETVNESLRVGEDGDLVGEITNTGERRARNVVVEYDSELSNVFARENQYAVGTLRPGETEQFRFRFGVSEDGEPGPRVFEFQTRYRNHEGEVRLDDARDLGVTIAEQRDSFTIDPVDATLAPGESGTVEMTVTNEREERVTNVRVKTFTDSPLSSADDEAFITALAPGESETVAFELSAAGGALAKTYPVEADVRYDDERGDTQLSGTYRVPVEVTDAGGGGPSPFFLGGFVLVAGGLAVVFRDRLLALGDRLP